MGKISFLFNFFKKKNGIPYRIFNKVFPQYSKVFSQDDIFKYCKSIHNYDHILWDFNNRRDYKFTDKLFNGMPKHLSRLDILNRFPDELELLDKFTYIDIFAEMSISQRHWSKLSYHYGGGGIFFPFLDKNVVQQAFNHSWSLKLDEHKKLLLEVGRKQGLGDDILLRSKTGMSVSPLHNLDTYNSFISIIRHNIKSDYNEIFDSNASLKTNFHW